MTRLGLSPERTLAEDIKNLRTNQREIKQRQFIGPDSLIIKQTQSANTWDVNGETVLTSAFDATWRVTFTPNTDRLAYAMLDFKWQITPDNGYQQVVAYDDPSDIAGSDMKSWIVGLIPNNDFTNNTALYLKFVVRSPASGTLTWTRLT